MSLPLPPSISQGEIALDPVNGIVWYLNDAGTPVATTWSWLRKDLSVIETDDKVEITGDVDITGNLYVEGSTITVDAESVVIKDNFIVVNSTDGVATSSTAGLEVERGVSTNVQIRWNESIDKWQFTNDGATFYDISSIIENSVELGTHTTGDYVENISAGSGISISGGTGESSNPTISNSGVLSINGNTGNITGIVTTSDTGIVTSNMIANNTIVNADVSASAAIDKTKISGTAITAADTGTVTSTMIADQTIVNADISTSAAISHSKLAAATAGQILLGTTTTGIITATTVSGDITINGAGLTAISSGVIVNADINASAAIAISKLASGTSGQIIIANGSGVPTYTTISGDITISNTGVATIAANSVALGTDTTGNYVASLVAGTGVSLLNNTGESSTPTVSIGQSVGTTDTVTFNTVNANLVGNVTGTVSNISNHSIDNLSDVAISGATNGDFLRYNGSNWINDPVNLTTDTVGDYVKNLVAGTGITITNNSGEGATPTIAFSGSIDQVSDIVITAAANGQTLIYDGTNWINTTFPSSEPIGHENKADSIISFNESTREFSISPATSSYTVWCTGKRYVKTSTEKITIPDTSGLYYIYFNSSGALAYKTTFFTWDEDTPTAYVYWNDVDNKAYFLADERHGVALDWATHEYLHRTRGAAIANGFGANNYTIVGDGSADADAKIDIANGTFFDEDLQVDITHAAAPTANTWEQRIQNGAYIPVFYKSNSSWKKDTATQFPVKNNGGRAQYNIYSGGTWSTTEIDNSKYGVMFIVATNNLNEPILSIMGQAQYTDQGSAEAATWDGLDLTGFPIVEFRPLYKIVFQTATAYTNTPKTKFVNLLDLRQIISTGAGGSSTAVSDHGSLTGLSDDDHLQYLTTSRHDALDHSTALNSAILNDLGDVNITSATANQGLIWNGSSWVNSSIPLNLDGLSDVIISSAAANEVLKYDGTNWVNATSPSSIAGTTYFATIGNGSTTTFTINHGLSTRDVVVSFTETSAPYASFSTLWEATTLNAITVYFETAPTTNSVRVSVYAAVSGAALSTDLDSLSDVALSGLANGDFLRYNGTTWINDPVNLATDTVGNYVQNLVAGTGITITNNSGEAATPTIAVTSNTYQPLDPDLTAIAGLTGTSGLLKKTAADTWVLDTNIYITSLALNELTNVNAATPSNDQVLAYDTSTSKWINKTFSATVALLDSVGDVTAPSPSNGDFLKWNGTAWVNDSIDLGTDTNGNYVSNVSAGAGINVSHTPGEGSTATISTKCDINAITSAGLTSNNYNLVAGDIAKLVTIDNGATNASVTIPLSYLSQGDRVDILNKGTGILTIKIASGGSLYCTPQGTANEAKLRSQWSSATIVKLDSSDTWLVIGDLQE